MRSSGAISAENLVQKGWCQVVSPSLTLAPAGTISRHNLVIQTLTGSNAQESNSGAERAEEKDSELPAGHPHKPAREREEYL
jgi:hypothetical protein